MSNLGQVILAAGLVQECIAPLKGDDRYEELRLTIAQTILFQIAGVGELPEVIREAAERNKREGGRP